MSATTGVSWAAEVDKEDPIQKYTAPVLSTVHELPTIPKTFDDETYDPPEAVIHRNDANNQFTKYSWKIDCDPAADENDEDPPMVLIQQMEMFKSETTYVNHAVAKRRKWTKYGMSVYDEDGPNAQTTNMVMEDIPIVYANRRVIKADDMGVKLTETEEAELQELKRTINQQLKLNRLTVENMGTSRSMPAAGPTNENTSFINRVKANVGNRVSTDAIAGSAPGPDRPGRPSGADRYGQDEGCGIRITNLSENITDGDIHDLFGQCGRIKRVYLAKDKKTSRAKGFAYVTFERKSDAEKAIKMLHRYAYDHLILNVEMSRSQDK